MLYHILINTDKLSIEQAANFIIAGIQKLVGESAYIHP
jgi:hypothetical protein